MKTDFKLSSKFHVFIIVSVAAIVLGLLVGIICQFVSNGFFNYSEDYASYKSITVTYEDTDFSGEGEEPSDKIKEFCNEAFTNAGIKSYQVAVGETSTGGTVIYKFVYSTDSDRLDEAKTAINAELSEYVKDNASGNIASATASETLLSGGYAISMAAIAVAVCIVLHFIYFVIRYKLTMALGAVLADIHNIALFLMLAALTRIPVGSSIAAYAVITVVLTVIGTCFLFDRMRKNFKDEELKKLTAFELTDKSADESFVINTVMPACLAAVSVVLFVLLSISSLSPVVIISPVLLSIISFVSCAYGTAFFVPSVYSRIKLLSDKAKKSNSNTAKTK